MATLTKSTGTVTLSGAAEKVTLPASYGWVWVKNMSEGDIFAGLSADISEGADGVLTIPSGECGRVQTDGFSSVYLLGTGNALVVAQNYADCPFKVVKKGGEIPDLSAYAKTADVPNIKVNEAVNADTVGGIRPEEISTTPIKKISFQSVATNSGGGGNLFTADFGTPITIACTSRGDTQCTSFYYKDNNAWLLLAKDAATLDPIPIGTYSFDVWYI